MTNEETKIDEITKQTSHAVTTGTPWNLEGIAERAPLFVVDEPNAAGILKKAGYNPVAVNGMGNFETVLKAIQKRHTGPIINALPDTFTEQSQALQAHARNHSALYIRVDEISNANYDAFNPVSEDERAKEALEALHAQVMGIFESHTASEAAGALALELGHRKQHPAPKTFSKALDRLLGGGVYPGLYIFGGEPGMGKTALVMQLADHLAANGTTVFVYALDTGKTDIVARSISRMTFEKARGKGEALSYRQIMDCFETNGPGFDRVAEAAGAYSEAVPGLYIFDGGPGFCAKNITRHFKSWMEITEPGQAPPVVVVDYLQMLAPPRDRLTDKQALDENIRELNALVTEHRAAVFAITSWNRTSYSTAGGMGSGKGSGDLEYTAVAQYSLQSSRLLEEAKKKPAERSTPEQIAEEMEADAKKNLPRAVTVTVTKGRFLPPGMKAEFLFRGAYSHFQDKPTGEPIKGTHQEKFAPDNSFTPEGWPPCR